MPQNDDVREQVLTAISTLTAAIAENGIRLGSGNLTAAAEAVEHLAKAYTEIPKTAYSEISKPRSLRRSAPALRSARRLRLFDNHRPELLGEEFQEFLLLR